MVCGLWEVVKDFCRVSGWGEASPGAGNVAGISLVMASHSIFFLQVCVHSTGWVPAWPVGDAVFHCDDICICELLARWLRLPLVLGSTQLDGNHRGEWSPEAGGEALHPGQFGEQGPCLSGTAQLGEEVWEGQWSSGLPQHVLILPDWLKSLCLEAAQLEEKLLWPLFK